MMIIVAFTLFLASTLAEPPVDNRYLPPQASSSSAPSQTYGTPGFGSQRQTDAIFSRPSSTYGAPSRSNSRPSTQYGPPGNTPSQLYGSPRSMRSGFVQRPSARYLPAAPSQLYGTPNQGGQDSFGPDQNGLGAQSRQYLPPNRNGYAGDDGSNGEPANYSFEYMVKDDASGNDFGHREARQGDRAEGLYYVVLPDGRKQTVEYEADQNGYKPRISYEDTGLGSRGYARGNQGGNNQGAFNGYPTQEGPY